MAIIQLYERSGENRVQIRASDAEITKLLKGTAFLVPDRNNKSLAQGETSSGRQHILKQTAKSHHITSKGEVMNHELAEPQEVLDQVSKHYRLISTHYDRNKDLNVYVFTTDGA